MRVYLVQHAQAKPAEVVPDRPLTAQGISDAQTVGEFLARAGIEIAAIWHSGKARAAQTADVLARHLSGAEVQAVEHLSPGDPPKPILKRLLDQAGDVMVVGHLPHLEKLASLIIAGDADVEAVAFSKACVLCLSLNSDGRGCVHWMITPELLG